MGRKIFLSSINPLIRDYKTFLIKYDREWFINLFTILRFNYYF